MIENNIYATLSPSVGHSGATHGESLPMFGNRAAVISSGNKELLKVNITTDTRRSKAYTWTYSLNLCWESLLPVLDSLFPTLPNFPGVQTAIPLPLFLFPVVPGPLPFPDSSSVGFLGPRIEPDKTDLSVSAPRTQLDCDGRWDVSGDRSGVPMSGEADRPASPLSGPEPLGCREPRAARPWWVAG